MKCLVQLIFFRYLHWPFLAFFIYFIFLKTLDNISKKKFNNLRFFFLSFIKFGNFSRHFRYNQFLIKKKKCLWFSAVAFVGKLQFMISFLVHKYLFYFNLFFFYLLWTKNYLLGPCLLADTLPDVPQIILFFRKIFYIFLKKIAESKKCKNKTNKNVYLFIYPKF